MGGGPTFRGGPSFARVRYIILSLRLPKMVISVCQGLPIMAEIVELNIALQCAPLKLPKMAISVCPIWYQ